MRAEGNKRHEQIRVLLLGVDRAERTQIARVLAGGCGGVTLLPVCRPADAAACAGARQVDAILCGMSALAGLRQQLAGCSGEARSIPVVVLVPPGAEQTATQLVENECVDLVVQSGNYPVLLPVLLRRALRREATSREALARMIRHEINNPLTGVLGNAELILAEEAALPPPVPDRLATIINLVVRIRDLLGTLEERLRRDGCSPDHSPPHHPNRRVASAREPVR
ncbi:MAG: histidine kinase dimerization/phospho-acceptor domain-containing protein [Terriglobia bacterium]